jgi:hypothetical protein
VIHFFYYLFIYGEMGLTSGLHTCKAGALPLEPQLQPILFWLFFGDEVLTYYLPGLALNCSPPNHSASKVASIKVISHWCPAVLYLFKNTKISQAQWFMLLMRQRSG